jgi:hypothetical protein
MSNSKNQHIIPQCYLKQFVDPYTSPGQEPYVWIFEREPKRGKKKALKFSGLETVPITACGKNLRAVEPA